MNLVIQLICIQCVIFDKHGEMLHVHVHHNALLLLDINAFSRF